MAPAARCEAVAMADRVKKTVRAFVKYHGAMQVLLRYLGPLSGVCFIGIRQGDCGLYQGNRE